MLKARFFFFVSLNKPLRLQLKNCLRIWIASVVEVPVLFSSGRKVLDCSLSLDEFGTSCCFPQGGKSSICIFCCRSTSLERRAIFLREERPCLFIIAQLDILFDFPPLDEFGTSCCFLKRKHSSICIVVIARRIWNVVLVIDFVCLRPLELASY